MQRLYAAANLPEAHLLLGLLRGQRIDAHVFNENAQGAVGEIPFTHAYPEVWIENSADLLRARAIVEDYEHSRHLGENRVCGECSEENPASFDLCWRCGTNLVPAD
jgi:hypothetical protein